jgi:hypothetical protein
MTPFVPTTQPSLAELKKAELKFINETGDVGTKFEDRRLQLPPV